MFGFLAALSGCNCAGCNKPDELFGFWLRRSLGSCAESGFRLELRAERKNNCSGFGVSGLEFSGLQLWPGRFYLEFRAGGTARAEQLFAFLASGQASCNTNISGCPLHSQRQMFDTKKCIFCLIM